MGKRTDGLGDGGLCGPHGCLNLTSSQNSHPQISTFGFRLSFEPPTRFFRSFPCRLVSITSIHSSKGSDDLLLYLQHVTESYFAGRQPIETINSSSHVHHTIARAIMGISLKVDNCYHYSQALLPVLSAHGRCGRLQSTGRYDYAWLSTLSGTLLLIRWLQHICCTLQDGGQA